LEQNSPKIQKVKEALAGLLKTYPNSQEAENWKKMQEDLSKSSQRCFILKRSSFRARKMAQQLRSLAAIQENLSSNSQHPHGGSQLSVSTVLGYKTHMQAKQQCTYN
jgi:hypothetical protein